MRGRVMTYFTMDIERRYTEAYILGYWSFLLAECGGGVVELMWQTSERSREAFRVNRRALAAELGGKEFQHHSWAKYHAGASSHGIRA